jgi:flagellar secretion chaperone FliS
MNSPYPNSAYGTSHLANYLDQKILSASPLELVAMLYARAISEIEEARRQLVARNIALRSRSISNACELIGELDSSLDLQAGGELAVRLRSLYGYSLVRLLDANQQQSDEPLAEVLGLLVTMSEAWETIVKKEAPSRPPYATPGPPESIVEKSPAFHWDQETAATGQSHSWTL